MASQHAQLCSDCQSIVSKKKELTYGTFYPRRSWRVAKQHSSCHLCDIIDMAWRRLSRDTHTASHDEPVQRRFKSSFGVEEEYDGELWSVMNKFTARNATPVHYALKVLNDGWARYGDGPMWPTVDFDGDYDDEYGVACANLQALRDPTDYGLSKLLSTDAVELTDGSIEFWLAMVFADYVGNSIVLPLEIQTDDEAEAIAQVNLEHQLSTGTPENMRLAKHWLHNCLENHPRCLPTAHARSTDWLPTRLLYVGPEISFRLRLVSTARSRYDPSSVSYAALSYRWGDQSQFCLTLANIQRYHESLAFCELSKTLQEAVMTCRSIGLEYLWVDALCIVQDDFHDWSRESAVMSKVYHFATCTIVAANSGDADSGCFAKRNQYQVRPCSVPNPLNPYTSKHRFYIRPQFLKDIFEEEVRQSAWYTRGWVFQERILSSRLLIFGKTQILWACQEIQAAETWPNGKTSENFIDQFDSFEVEKARFEKLLDPSRHVHALNHLWAVLLRDYAASVNNFTKMSDRLVAIQGLAFQIRESTGRQYCAGLWLDEGLPASLLWIALDPTLERPTDNRAPSWSWASLDCAIEFNTGRFKGSAAIRCIQLPDVEKHPTDHHFDGITSRLQASGHVLRVLYADGLGLVVYKIQPKAWEITSKIKATVKEMTRRIQPTAKKIINKIRPTTKEINRNRGSLLDHIWPAAWELFIMPLCLSLLFLLCFLPLKVLSAWNKWKGLLRGSSIKMDTGVMVPSVDKGPGLRASCFFDSPLGAPSFETTGSIFIIPILNGYQTSGLIVQPIPGVVHGYKRVGVFVMNSFQLEKFKTSSGRLVDQNFCLM